MQQSSFRVAHRTEGTSKCTPTTQWPSTKRPTQPKKGKTGECHKPAHSHSPSNRSLIQTTCNVTGMMLQSLHFAGLPVEGKKVFNTFTRSFLLRTATRSNKRTTGGNHNSKCSKLLFLLSPPTLPCPCERFFNQDPPSPQAGGSSLLLSSRDVGVTGNHHACRDGGHSSNIGKRESNGKLHERGGRSVSYPAFSS